MSNSRPRLPRWFPGIEYLDTYEKRAKAVAFTGGNLKPHTNCPNCYNYLDCLPNPQEPAYRCHIGGCGWSGPEEELLDTLQAGQTILPSDMLEAIIKRGWGGIVKVETANAGVAPDNRDERVETKGDKKEKRIEAAATTAPNPDRKRSTVPGEARDKLIAALTLHHQYSNTSCLNLIPVGSNELAKKAKVSPSSASKFFNDQFQGYSKYRAVCRDPGKLADSLKALNGEFAPHDLYGRRPPGEDNRDDAD